MLFKIIILIFILLFYISIYGNVEERKLQKEKEEYERIVGWKYE